MKISPALRCAMIAGRFPREHRKEQKPFGVVIYRMKAPKLCLPTVPFVCLESEEEEKKASSLVAYMKKIRPCVFAEVRLPDQAPLSPSFVSIFGDPERDGLDIFERWLTYQREVVCVPFTGDDGKRRYAVDLDLILPMEKRMTAFADKFHNAEAGEMIAVTPDIREGLIFWEQQGETAAALIQSLREPAASKRERAL